MSRTAKWAVLAGVAVVAIIAAVMVFSHLRKPFASQDVSASAPLTVPMPAVTGKTGRQGQDVVWNASGFHVLATLVDAVPVECSRVEMADAPIVRTEPPTGGQLTLAKGQEVTLFVDRSKVPRC